MDQLERLLLRGALRPERRWKLVVTGIVICVCLPLIIAAGVYVTGGTQHPTVHFMYLPVTLAAFYFDYKAGIILGLFCGLLLGPLMPLNTASGEGQPIVSWVLRSLFLAAEGGVVGFLVYLLKATFAKLRENDFHDHATGLPNMVRLLEDIL